MRRIKLLASVALLATLVTPAAKAGSLYAFGDSLSDDGNMYNNFHIPPIENGSPIPVSNTLGGPGSYGGRYSNGPVWVEYLAPMLGLGYSSKNNYAYGGAFTGPINGQDNLNQQVPNAPANLPGINTEIAQFAAAGGSFGASDVVTLWGGANDYFEYSNTLTSVMQTGEVKALLQNSNAAAAYQTALGGGATQAQAVQAAEGAFLQSGGTKADLTTLMQGGAVQALLAQSTSVQAAYQKALTNGGTAAQAVAAAETAYMTPNVTSTLTQLYLDTNALIGLGARMLIVPNLPDLGLTPANNSTPQSAAAADALSDAHNANLPALMQALHVQTGANIIVLNTQALLEKAVANPALYGLSNVTGECYDTASCAGYLFWNDVHPTTQAQYLIAEYAARSLIGFESLTVPAQLGTNAAQNFTSTLNGRLDALQNGASGVSYGINGMNGGTADPDHKLSLFLSEGGQFGSHHTDPNNFALGYTYSSSVTTMGLDYRWNDHFVSGLAVGYNDSHADVKDGGGKVQDQGVVVGLYALATQGDAYAKVTGGFDKDYYKATHPGVLGSITGKPDGQTWSASTTLGLNFHPQPNVILGPDVGLAYTNSGLGDYTETGDSLLTEHVDNQNFQQLVSSAGLHASTTVDVRGVSLAPYGSAAAQFRLSNQSHHFSSYFTDMPGVTLTSTFPTLPGAWALFSAGLNARFTQRLNANLNVATTAFKDDGNAVQVNGNLSWKF